MKKKKILIVIQLLRRGGVELVALNFALNLPRDKYDVTLLLVDINEHQDQSLVDEVSKLNIKIEKIPGNIGGYLQKYKFIKAFIKKNSFDIVHSHVMLFSGLVMTAAKKCGVFVRVSHSHATKWNRKENIAFKVYKAFMRCLINKNSTDLLACSNDAGKYLYGEKEFKKRGRVVTNGIDTSKYAYSPSLAADVKKELSLSETDILVGHIGTIYYIKNQTFLVDVFNCMLKNKSNLKLILVGEEADSAPVREKVARLGLNDRVIFAGQRNDIPRLLQAMDIMIFPSLFEALPVSLIEAQAAKLPCLISDAVTTDVRYNSNAVFLSLDAGAQAWADKAFELLEQDRESVSTDGLVESYDISHSVEALEKIYLS